MDSINVDELLKILPKLIRENDTVKGAIITALSGIVATREDIKDLIREMDKRFEAMQEQMDKRFEAMDKRFEVMDKRFEAMQEQMDKRFETMDKRFEAMQEQMNKRFETMDDRLESLETGQKRIEATLLAMQNKTGPELEHLVLDVMKATLQLEHVDASKIRNEPLVDAEGIVYYKGYSTDIDVLLDDGNTYLVEVKATADNRDVRDLIDKARLYEHLHQIKTSGLFLVALRISRKHLDHATKMGIRVVSGDITKQSDREQETWRD